MKLTLDFETRSTVDLASAGPWKYAADQSTDVLCLAVKPDTQVTQLWIPDWLITGAILELLPPGIILLSDEELLQKIDAARVLEAHNAEFERSIWKHVMGRYGFPEIPLAKWDCTAARAAMCALPRQLKDACRVLRVPVQKDMEGHRLMLKLCKPRLPRKAEKEANQNWQQTTYWHDDPKDFVRLFQYCIQDVEAEHSLSKALRHLSSEEKAIWRVDQAVNERGVAIDLESITGIIDTLRTHEKALLQRMAQLTGGMVESPRQVAKMTSWLAGNGVIAENLQKHTVVELLQGDMPGNVRQVLEIRQSLGKASTAKFQAMLDRADDDGRARALFLYHAASTGRYGGKAIQPQNMPRDCYDGATLEEVYQAFGNGDTGFIELFYDDPFQAASRCIRGALTAGPGKELICADYNSIEARGNAWLAGEESILKAFRAGLDLYKVAAAGTFGVKYNEVDKKQRQLGKVQILALGYQGGIGAFAAMAVAYSIDLETLPALVMPFATRDELDGPYGAKALATTYLKRNPEAMSFEAAVACDVLKRKWRVDNPNITASWKSLENAAVDAVMNPGQEFRYRRVVYRTWRDSLGNNYLLCKLPSGRILYYFDPQIREITTPWDEAKEVITYYTVDSMTKQWVRRPAYGGLLCENNTQAMCRDIMAQAMVRCEDAGYPVVLHAHDEIVSEVPEGTGDLDAFCKILIEVPTWATGMPIASDGWVGKRYRK